MSMIIIKVRTKTDVHSLGVGVMSLSKHSYNSRTRNAEQK